MSCGTKSLVIYKNYPTRFDSVDWLSISFDSVISLTGFTMDFKLGSATRHFTDLSQASVVNLTKDETNALDLGLNNASIIVTDTSSNSRPFSTAIPVMVKNWVEGDQELDTFNMDVNVTLDNTTQFTIKIETAKVSQEWVESLISAHNTSTSAHSYIQGLITTEATARQNADNVLAASINTEAGTRAAADTVLTNNLNTEIATRENADNVLATSIATKQPLLTSANAGTGISISGSGSSVIISSSQASAVWGNITGTLSNQTDLQQALNGKQATISDLDTIRSGASLGATALQDSDVINALDSTETKLPLSANMGKVLQDQITTLKQRGRYLSVWNCETGFAETEPTVNPYTYKAGDYFIVGVVATGGADNYRPVGSSYDKEVPSRTVETADVKVNDTYYYDGSSWTLLSTEQPTIAFSTLAGSPYDNSNLASALNGKQASITSSAMLSSDLVDDTNHTHKFVTASQITTWNSKVGSLSDLGITATASELNVLDGITATTTELNYVDGVTSNIQTQLNNKQASLGYTPENVANKVTSISSSSTDTQYPSAKCVYTIVGNIESAINTIRGVS